MRVDFDPCFPAQNGGSAVVRRTKDTTPSLIIYRTGNSDWPATMLELHNRYGIPMTEIHQIDTPNIRLQVAGHFFRDPAGCVYLSFDPVNHVLERVRLHSPTVSEVIWDANPVVIGNPFANF